MAGNAYKMVKMLFSFVYMQKEIVDIFRLIVKQSANKLFILHV